MNQSRPYAVCSCHISSGSGPPLALVLGELAFFVVHIALLGPDFKKSIPRGDPRGFTLYFPWQEATWRHSNPSGADRERINMRDMIMALLGLGKHRVAAASPSFVWVVSGTNVMSWVLSHSLRSSKCEIDLPCRACEPDLVEEARTKANRSRHIKPSSPSLRFCQAWRQRRQAGGGVVLHNPGINDEVE